MFVDVILPLPLEGPFSYHVPQDMESKICTGCRVIVQFGASKLYTGIVVSVDDDKPKEGYAIKDIIEAIDDNASVLPQQLKCWQWISQYYMCSVGEVYKAAVPSGMKMESETQMQLNEEFDTWEKLTKKEMDVLDLVQYKKLKTISQLQKATSDNHIMSILRSLMKKNALTIQEEIKRKFSPKTETHVRLAKPYQTEENVNRLAQILEKHSKRYQLLMKYLELSGMVSAFNLKNDKLIQEVSRTELLKLSQVSAAVLSGMRAKGYIETYEYETGRIKKSKVSITEQVPLSEAQQKAYESIKQSFQTKKVCLLHGVTSSGKTEVYIRLIREQLGQGKQVLYLLPEIALTTQITQRLQRIFGDQLGVYHSRYPDNERVEIWNKQLSEKPFSVILGARSALFLPYKNLGMVIVDEEHETSYKQQEPAPRYNARDTAIVLASLYDASVLLGTATPSMESYNNARKGKYGYVTLMQRYGDINMPVIKVVDIKDLLRRKMMSLPFSPQLTEEMKKALDNGEQVILFQNRRGYTPVLECHKCGWVPTCQFCDVSLTYHQEFNKMVCHYCGSTYDVPRVCPNCGEQEIHSYGFGTEKIEEEVRKLFPQAKTARLDLDTTQSRNAYEHILSDFSQQKTNILVGTQMVSKGLDFDNVHVVGILDADTMMTRPDFRAFERSFQMMSQVAGRAGRRNKPGCVILQTKHTDYPVIKQIVENNYEEMFQAQDIERKNFKYPPYSRLIYVYLKHRNDKTVGEAAKVLGISLRQSFGNIILGPDKPVVSKIHMMHIRRIMVKVPLSANTNKVRTALMARVKQLLAVSAFHSVNIYYDVDPI